MNKEIKRRIDVVGVFPNPAALLPLAGVVPIEQHHEWDAAGRRDFSEHSVKQLDANSEAVAIPEITAAQSEPLTEHLSRRSTTQRDATPNNRDPPSLHLTLLLQPLLFTAFSRPGQGKARRSKPLASDEVP